MNDFKVIPQAPDYKINKEQEIRRVSNDKPLFLIGQKALLKKPDGTMQHFIIDELVNELFGEKQSPVDLLQKSEISELSTIPENVIQNPPYSGLGEDLVHALQESGKSYESEDKNLANNEPPMTILGDIHLPQVKRGRGRPAKPKDPNAPIKVKGKRGRPAKPKDPNAPIKVKGKRGRPLGSKNKAK